MKRGHRSIVLVAIIALVGFTFAGMRHWLGFESATMIILAMIAGRQVVNDAEKGER